MNQWQKRQDDEYFKENIHIPYFHMAVSLLAMTKAFHYSLWPTDTGYNWT